MIAGVLCWLFGHGFALYDYYDEDGNYVKTVSECQRCRKSVMQIVEEKYKVQAGGSK